MTDQVLGHYRLLEEIGSGGMGEVYRAHDDRLGRDVALKILKPELTGDPDRLRRFEQEARAAAALNHPNIVAVYDIGVQGTTPFIVSELLEGQTLRQRLLEGPLPVKQAADFAQQIAQGLVAAHEKHIVHRDLKPENLFLVRDGRVKILDFGIAKLSLPEATDEQSIATMTTQTKSGSVLGTAAYMSPEQLRARPVDARSDIFSLGAILYEMLTGKRAFVGESEADTITAVLKEEPPEMTEVRQGIPDGFEPIVRHCLEKEPENRFQSARDLVFALGTLTGTTTSRAIAFRKPRRWGRLAAVTAGVLLLAAAGVLLGTKLKPATNPEFRRLTFERGTVYSARFSPDGRSVLYDAAWNGRPMELYSTAADSPLEHPLGITSAALLSVSPSSELALLLRGLHGSRLDFLHGVLARAPLAGGSPREVLEDVRSADYDQHGELAVVQSSGGRTRLEYPIGNILYETNGWISNVRFSPDGENIAYIDHPVLYDDGGAICVVDRAGHSKTLSSGWESAVGLSWSPDGKEIWFAATTRGEARTLWAVNMAGKQRHVLDIPGGFTLQDIAADGRLLVSSDTDRLAMEFTGPQNNIQDLSWYDWTVARDISPNRQWILFEEGSAPAGPNFAVCVRKVDGSPPIRLGDGTAGGFSPDGKWATAVSPGTPQHISLLPVGAGQPRNLSFPSLERLVSGSAHFMPNSNEIVFGGNEPGKPSRTYLVSVTGEDLRPVTPEGKHALLPSPDGQYLAGVDGPQHRVALYPVNGGPARVTSLDSRYDLTEFSPDGRSLYAYDLNETPLKIYRFDIATENLTTVRELAPADRAGVVSIAPVVTDPTGSYFAYSYYQTLSVLYVISGVH